MAYARTTTVDTGPAGDTIVQGVTDLDTDLTAIYTDLNTHEALTETHGATGAVVGTTNTQTLTNKTLSAPTLTGTVTLSGATMTGGTYTSPTINTPTVLGGTFTSPTINTPTVVTPTVSGGTFTSPTITGTGAIAGTFTGNLTGNVKGNVTGNLTGNATGATGTFSSSVAGGATAVTSNRVDINSTGSGNRYAYVDFYGDDTYTPALRIIRSNVGANATSTVTHRGTGNFVLNTTEAAPIIFETTNTTRAVIAAAGTVSLASQPLFSATVTATVENCTGVNSILTYYTLRSTSSPACNWTEITDRATNFSGGTFTAPVTGNYLFTGFIDLIGLSGNTSWTVVHLITSNRTYTVTNINSIGIQSVGNAGYGFSVIADMDTADTAYLEIVVYDGTNAKTVDITTSTHFQGYLLP